MHNLMAKFKKILEICKQYAGNQVGGKRKVLDLEHYLCRDTISSVLFQLLHFNFGAVY